MAATDPQRRPATAMGHDMPLATHDHAGSIAGLLPRTQEACPRLPWALECLLRRTNEWAALQGCCPRPRRAARDFHGPWSASCDSRTSGQHCRAATHDPGGLPAASMGPSVNERVGSTAGPLHTIQECCPRLPLTFSPPMKALTALQGCCPRPRRAAYDLGGRGSASRHT